MDNRVEIEQLADDIEYACRVELSKEQRVEIARVLVVLGYTRQTIVMDIYKYVDKMRKNPMLDPKDSYGALVAYNAVCTFLKREYKLKDIDR